MASERKSLDKLIYDLKERAKELTCLYEVQELFNKPVSTVEEICQEIVTILPSGWQYPDVCQAKITYDNFVYKSSHFEETSWGQNANIEVQGDKVGSISVYYTAERPLEDESPFLKEERKLINTVAEQFGFHILHRKLKEVFQEQKKFEEGRGNKWRIFLGLLDRTDPKLLMQISRKMLNYLCWNGIEEAERILELFNPTHQNEMGLFSETNRPYQDQIDGSILDVSDDVFSIAEKHLSEDVILNIIQNWIKEDRSDFLIDVLENPNASFLEILSAIKRYHHLSSQGLELSIPRERWLKTSLIHLLLSDQTKFVDIAKNYIQIDNFSDLLEKIIHPEDSLGRLGGKSSGLFLAALILGKISIGEQGEMLSKVWTPRTRYLTADILHKFIRFNNLEDMAEQKYKGIEQVRQEYPDILYVFKNSPFPPEIVKSISQGLDEFREIPLIVRSSSLLEDQSGASFTGKYKSLFIANQGSKAERLHALLDAIAEVYASTFGPDPIEYRLEHGLVDRKEEMGIMIQEVVGRKIGHYYLPAFAGVAYSKNEFRWSSRIKRNDGLIRIVPGLGTRAVDRLRDDYPVLIAPGQPGLRANITQDEIIRFSPKKIDVINLEIGAFETVDVQKLLREHGHEYPFINKLVSIIKHDHIEQPGELRMNF
ncbi:MAG: PEP/pyruvate-binding domain-containing protein, partial [Anaerolineaceae bacterium]|nr:PEP/pyruvate-binding domain-containing protein [Anaerolineaceae bacterium]